MRTVRPAALLAASSLVCAAAFLAACEGTRHEEKTSAEPTGQAQLDSHAPSAWASMSHDQRADLMKRKVLPQMKAAFSAVEPDEFSKMNCATCHGAGAKDKSFKMPNPALPKLPAGTDAEGWARLAAEEPEMMAFMKTQVVPQMAAILGEKPYDPATHEGFGCVECHTAEK